MNDRPQFKPGHINRGGRLPYERGEGVPNSKLTEEDVRAIRNSTQPNSFWAKLLGVSSSTVSRARRGTNWTHVQMDGDK